MAHAVFISYSSKDKQVADGVCSALESKGIPCWMAPRNIVAGMAWSEAILEAIGSSRVMVIILSAHANASVQVMREVERAVNKGIIVLPFRIENVRPAGSLEYFLSTPHWFDAITPPLEQHLGTLAEAIAKQLKNDSQLQDVSSANDKAVKVAAPQDQPTPTPFDKPQNILPVPPTALIGRERELGELKDLLLRDEVRLVTLTGLGGTGKTRLAREMAHNVQAEFKDGAWFVPLAPLLEPALVASTIAQALGLKVNSPLEGLKFHLRDKHTLLVLDNFEQIIAAAPVISELLMAAPGLEVVVTSREVLNLSGEYVYHVPPLALPEAKATLEVLSQSEAVQLFVERARAVKTGFALNAENAPFVAEICQHLDGLPLAIELAAARTKLLSPKALLERLDSRLEVLKGGARDLPSRQQTLRSAIDWSYQLLDERERDFFTRLSLFVGGWTLEAAEALCGEVCDDMMEALGSLLDKSLIKQQDEERFVMLETLREYALEKLTANGGLENLREQHANYFLAVAKQAAPHLKGQGQAIWLKRLEHDHDNFRAVMNWALAHEKLELISELSWSLWLMWWINAHANESYVWVQEALKLLAKQPSISKEMRAKLTCVLGSLSFWSGKYQEAMPYLAQGPSLFEDVDEEVEAHALSIMAAMAGAQGQLARSDELNQKSLTLFQGMKSLWGMSAATIGLAGNAATRGDLPRSKTLFEETLALARQQGDKLAMIFAFNGLAILALLQADTKRAKSLFAESMKLCLALGFYEGASWCFEGHVLVAALEHQSVRSVRFMAIAATIREAMLASPWTDTEESFPASAWANTDQTIAQVKVQIRQSLDEATFEKAWNEGKAMTFDQAVAYALKDERDEIESSQPLV